MSQFQNLSFQQLQLRHPNAFFQPLLFSRIKITGYLYNPWFLFTAVLISIAVMGCMIVLSQLLQNLSAPAHSSLSMEFGLIIFITISYPSLCWAKYQAQFSSQFYAKRLQVCIYLYPLCTILLIPNTFFWQLEQLNLLIICLICFSILRPIFIEARFYTQSTALQRIKLHKLRQLAYWAHNESLKSHPQTVANVQNLTAYYQALHHYAYAAEQQLSLEIRSHSRLSYYL